MLSEQINHAIEIIDDQHPLYDAPITKVLPYLWMFECCLPKKKKNFKRALRRSLLRKMGMKIPKTDIKIEQDPFCVLGK